jgi:hypothetical protein
MDELVAPGGGGKQKIVKRAWTHAEDELLIQAVRREGSHSWAVIARSLDGRNDKQARERWSNHLCPDVKKGEWTAEEDSIIFSSVAEHGTVRRARACGGGYGCACARGRSRAPRASLATRGFSRGVGWAAISNGARLPRAHRSATAAPALAAGIEQPRARGRCQHSNARHSTRRSATNLPPPSSRAPFAHTPRCVLSRLRGPPRARDRRDNPRVPCRAALCTNAPLRAPR